jgi:hypothetical protein
MGRTELGWVYHYARWASLAVIVWNLGALVVTTAIAATI